MKPIVPFITAVILFTSCKPAVSLVENMNSNKKFETKKEYVEFINRKIAIPKEKIVILNDTMYRILLNDVLSKHLATYYGIINANDFVSADQLKNQSCSGQIEVLYQKFESGSEEVVKGKSSESMFFKKIELDDSKNTLLFLYSYKLGGFSKSLIHGVVKDLGKKGNFDYRLISLDNNDIVNK